MSGKSWSQSDGIGRSAASAASVDSSGRAAWLVLLSALCADASRTGLRIVSGVDELEQPSRRGLPPCAPCATRARLLQPSPPFAASPANTHREVVTTCGSGSIVAPARGGRRRAPPARAATTTSYERWTGFY